jgi:hypothetical protein
MKTRATMEPDPAESLPKTIEAEDDPASVVDEMIGSATLREPPPGTDALYDALKAKYVH